MFVAVLVLLSVLAGGGPFAGVAAGPGDAVTIDSATEYGSGKIELVFNQTVSSVDWVDVYVDGTDAGRVSSPGAGDRVVISSPVGDVTPNRNLTVVAQVDRGSTPNQVLREQEILVAATTINASNSAHGSLSAAAETFEGEPIAFVSDDGTDVQVTVDERTGGNVFDVRTGAHSQVVVFDSWSLSPRSSYQVTFGTPAVVEWFNVSDLGLSGSLVSDAELYQKQFAKVSVASAIPNADVTVTLVDEFGTVADTDVVNLGRDRRAIALLSAPREGSYRIDVTHNETGNVVSAGDVTVTVAPAALGRPVLSASLGRGAVAPGEVTTLPINVANNGTVEVGSLATPALTDRVTTARGLTVRVDKANEAPLTVHAGTYAFGSLPAGRLVSLDVPVSIDESVEPGTYRVPINVSYRFTEEIQTNGSEITNTVRRDLNVTLTVDRVPQFSVRNVTTAVRAGGTDTLALTVENVGDAVAHASELRLVSSNADVSIGGARSATRSVGTWPAGERRRVTFEITAPPGTASQNLPLELTARYEDADGRAGEGRSRQVGITPLPAQPFELDSVSSTLTVGEAGQLRGRITNTGDERVRNAVVVLVDEHDQLTPIEAESVVGSLPPNTSADFSFPIQVDDDAEPIPAQLSVFVRYRRSDDTAVESPEVQTRAAVEAASPAFRVETAGGPIPAGGSGYFNLTVTNTQDSVYTDISLRLVADSPLSTVGEVREIERLEPGASTEVAVPVEVSGEALQKAYPVSLVFRYDDSAGLTQISETYRRAIEVVAPAEESGGLGLLPVAAVVVIAALLGLRVYRQRR